MVSLSTFEREQPSPASHVERLRAALNPEQVLAAFHRNWSLDKFGGRLLEGCTVDRLHSVGNRGHIIEYTLRFDASGERATQRMFGHLPTIDAGDELAVNLTKLRRRLPWKPRKWHPGADIGILKCLNLVVRPIGFDERVDGLWLQGGAYRQSIEALRAEGHLNAALDGFDTAQLLAHRLGKRAVLRLTSTGTREDGQHSAILKLYKGSSKHWRVSHRVTEAARNAGLDTPAIHHVIADMPALLMDDVGSPSLDTLAAYARAKAFAEAGAALARLHALDVGDLPRHGPSNEVDILARNVSQVCEVYPSLTPKLTAAFNNSVSQLDHSTDFETTVIHRDFHEKQILVGSERTYLIDFDTACLGDPAQDIANFEAHLRLRELQTGEKMDVEVAAFRAGYKDLRPLPSAARCSAHFHATLLRLACIYAFHSQWKKLTPTLLEEACA